jgi:hypothetical protein
LYPDFLPEYVAELGPDWKQYIWEFNTPENGMPEQVLFRIFFDVEKNFTKEMRLKNIKLGEVK